MNLFVTLAGILGSSFDIFDRRHSNAAADAADAASDAAADIPAAATGHVAIHVSVAIPESGIGSQNRLQSAHEDQEKRRR